MAREIRIERVRARRAGRRPAPAAPASVDEARRAIEETRGRLSATLDAIEDRVGAKKEAISERLDLLRPVRRQIRRHPWGSLGVAFGAGLLLARATGRREGAGAESPLSAGRLGRTLALAVIAGLSDRARRRLR